MTTNVTAYFGERIHDSKITTTDYSGSDTNGIFQFRGFILDTSNVGNVVIASAATAIYGVLENAPRANEACQLVIFGVTKVQAGGAFAVGDPLMCDANGNFVKWTTGSSHVQVGTALIASNGAKDIVTAFIFPNIVAV